MRPIPSILMVGAVGAAVAASIVTASLLVRKNIAKTPGAASMTAQLPPLPLPTACENTSTTYSPFVGYGGPRLANINIVAQANAARTILEPLAVNFARIACGNYTAPTAQQVPNCPVGCRNGGFASTIYTQIDEQSRLESYPPLNGQLRVRFKSQGSCIWTRRCLPSL